MSSSDRTDPPIAAVEISEIARATAQMAANEAGMTLANWVALAILGAAAEQAGLAAQTPAAAPDDDLQTVLKRLEAKLDQALATRSDGGLRQHYS